MNNMIKDIMTDYDISHYDISILLIFIVWFFVYLKYKKQWIITTVTIHHYLANT